MLTMVEILLAFFAAVGILSLLLVLYGHLLTPAFSQGSPPYLLLRLEGDAPGLEQSLRQVRFLRRGRLLPLRPLLLDCGLTELGRARVLLLLEEDPSLRCVRAKDVQNLIEKDDETWTTLSI